MAEVERTKSVKSGKWRTLESGWNATFSCRFRRPAGASVKVRYGNGRWFGRDSQKQTLDGRTDKLVSVGRASLAYARVQIKVQENTDVTYTYITVGP
jgi:hypothetical protein